jgi:ATP-dependent Clp protease ATP-binding subunit ClpX
MFEIPGRDDVGRVVIDGETVLNRLTPTLHPRKPAGRQRRAAS